MLRINFESKPIFIFVLFLALGLSAENKNQAYLLSHSEFTQLKKNLKFSYLTEVQQIMADAAISDPSHFTGLPKLESNPWTILNFILSSNYAEASQEDVVSEEEDLQDLLDLTQQLMGKQGYFAKDDPSNNDKIYRAKKQEIDQLIKDIKDKSRLTYTGDNSYHGYYEEIYKNINIAKLRLAQAGHEEGVQLPQLELAANTMKAFLDEDKDSATAEVLKKRDYRCIYAGFVIEKKSSKDRCRAVNRTKLFPGSKYEMDLKTCTDSSKKVMCNPLLYGYKPNLGSAGAGANACSDNALIDLKQKKANQAYCVDYGGNASQKCAEASGKEGKCVALKYIELNPEAWGELNTKLSKICSGKDMKTDLKNTCNIIKARMEDLNRDVRSGFIRFGGSKTNSSGVGHSSK